MWPQHVVGPFEKVTEGSLGILSRVVLGGNMNFLGVPLKICILQGVLTIIDPIRIHLGIIVEVLVCFWEFILRQAHVS